MRVRRIFRPTLAARLAPVALGGAAVVVALALATAVPGDLLGSAPQEATLQAAAGEVRVIDGGTLKLGERVLRLQALAVPERGQAQCRDAGGGSTDCGAASAQALARLVAARDLACKVQSHDRQGRAIGQCSAGGVELAASQVADGWAFAERGAPAALAALESTARQERRGLWSAATPPAERWRSGL